MRNGLLTAAHAWLFLALTAVSLAAPRAMSAADIIRFRTITAVTVAPDSRVAAIVVRSAEPEAGRYGSSLWLVPLTSAGARAKPVEGTRGLRAVSQPRWAPDGRTLAFLARRADRTRLFVIGRDGGEARPLTAFGRSISGFDWSPDGQRLAVLMPAAESAEEARRRTERDDAYSVEQQWKNHRIWILGREVVARAFRPGTRAAGKPAGEGEATALTGGRWHARDIDWSPDGARIAFVATPTPEADSDDEARVLVADVASGRVESVPGGELGTMPEWSPDGRLLAFVRPFNQNKASRGDVFVWRVGEAAARDISASIDRDVEAIQWTEDNRGVDVSYSRGATGTVARVDVADGNASTVWAPPYAFSRYRRAPGGWIFVRDDRPAEVWRVSDAAQRAIRLTTVNAAIADFDLPALETLTWRNGEETIEGILFKPAQFEAGTRYPLIVNPHGGPRGHSKLEMDPTCAYFTSQGYLVLRPNFRGSTGYGERFTKANVADWGDGPYTDVVSGVDRLIASGLADPSRVFLYGWSYGGYLGNWAATHGTRFRAIASGAGVADLRLQYVISDARRWRFDYFRGSPFEGHAALYEQQSPVTYVAAAKTPILFLHGERDVRVPLAQGLMMFRAIKDRGVPTDLVIYPREGHGFEEPRHVMDRAERVLDWFRRHDAPASR